MDATGDQSGGFNETGGVGAGISDEDAVVVAVVGAGAGAVAGASDGVAGLQHVNITTAYQHLAALINENHIRLIARLFCVLSFLLLFYYV